MHSSNCMYSTWIPSCIFNFENFRVVFSSWIINCHGSMNSLPVLMIPGDFTMQNSTTVKHQQKQKKITDVYYKIQDNHILGKPMLFIMYITKSLLTLSKALCKLIFKQQQTNLSHVHAYNRHIKLLHENQNVSNTK